MLRFMIGISIIKVALILNNNVLKTEIRLRTNLVVLLLFSIGLINVFADLMLKINIFIFYSKVT